MFKPRTSSLTATAAATTPAPPKMESIALKPDYESAAQPEAELAANLGLLSAVEHDASITQRSLAVRMGMALGLTNAYLRRAVGKGWIKITQAPARRYLYYLTPQGFAEKARLTREFLSDSLTFFRRVRGQCDDIFASCAARGWTRIVLVGAGDLAEIATLSAHNHGIQLVAVLDQKRNIEHFAGLPVVNSIDHAGPHDALLLTDAENPQAVFDELSQVMPSEKLLSLPVLHLSRSQRVKIVANDSDGAAS